MLLHQCLNLRLGRPHVGNAFRLAASALLVPNIVCVHVNKLRNLRLGELRESMAHYLLRLSVRMLSEEYVFDAFGVFVVASVDCPMLGL
jgi:hypothetical protein